jgi:hypothetical protein
MKRGSASIRSLFILAVGFSAALIVGSCGNGALYSRACTEIGCRTGLGLPFSRPLRDAGAYVVTLTLDGVEVVCQATLPFSGCAGGNPCSSANVLLEQSGCALPASEHSLVGMHIDSTPAMIRVTIARDGVEILQDQITPTYVRTQPNGEGCPPVCNQANATLTIP